MAIVYAADAQGRYMGSYDGVAPPAGAVIVPVGPTDGRQIWDGKAWTMPVAMSQADLQKAVSDAVQAYMDAAAQKRNYDGILSLCTYATSNNTKFAGEGQAGVDFRDACWTYCYDILAKAQAGTIPLPTPAGVVGGLPTLAWPS